MIRPAWLTAQVLLRLGVALAILAGLWWLYASITAKPKAEAKLAKNQVEAVQKSASDAVETVAGVGKSEAANADLSRANEKEIRSAQGANAPVDPAVRDATLRSVCKRPSYSGTAQCLQFTPADGMARRGGGGRTP